MIEYQREGTGGTHDNVCHCCFCYCALLSQALHGLGRPRSVFGKLLPSIVASCHAHICHEAASLHSIGLRQTSPFCVSQLASA